MSIELIIDRLLHEGRLFKIRSTEFELMGIPEADQPRTMYVSSDIMAVVALPFADTEEGERIAEFRRWLDNFVEGGEISVSENPDRKPPEIMMARVRPIEAEFWSIRVTEPEQTPGIRAIGAFSDVDEFVALTWDMRENIADSFDAEVQAGIDAWFDHFRYVRPHRGDNLHAYLTTHRAV